MSEAVPAHRALEWIGPLWHDIVIPQQHAVERLGGGNQLGAILGEDYLVDERVDGRILDADQIARAGLIGGLRAPVGALLIAGREGLAPHRRDGIVVPAPLTIDVLRGIHGAYRDGHAKSLKRRLIEQEEALAVRIWGQKLDRECLAILHVGELL